VSLLGCLALTLGFAGSAMGAGSTPKHAPIVIAADADFTSCKCVTSGHGTAQDPYVIGPWSINNQSGPAVTIDGTSGHLAASFDLHNLTIAGNSNPLSDGIVLNDVNVPVARVTGSQTSIQTVGTGILVEGKTTNVTLDGGAANANGPGVKSGGGVINKNSMGAVDVENSSKITIRGWQMNANGADGTPDWLGFNPSTDNWFVGGVRFFGVTDSTVEHNAANNDTSVSFSLFDSSRNTIRSNTANYPFTTNVLITDGSSSNYVTDNVFSTGDFVGILIADAYPGYEPPGYAGASHDNWVLRNSDHSDGPTGTEKAAGEAPSFVGGIVVLNGAYSNTIADNEAWSSAGGNLVWAQAIPDPSSKIGVQTEPPIIHCNVTLSDGGGGVANRNGNTWTGNNNHSQPQDGCIPPQ
jgi:parallel beta-helix repeat protein